MVKFLNINLVIIVTALITTIGTAPVWDDEAIKKAVQKMQLSASDIVRHRKRDVSEKSVDPAKLTTAYITEKMTKAVFHSVPLFSPFKERQLFQEPGGSTPEMQVLFTRAYHSLVFEKLKTLLMKIEHHASEPFLTNELLRVSPHLLRSYDLVHKCAQRFQTPGLPHHMHWSAVGHWRVVELPLYDYWWDRVRSILPPILEPPASHQLEISDDATAGEILEILRKRVQNVIASRRVDVYRGLPFNLDKSSDPTPNVVTLIAQIRSDARPFTFTEAQLLEVPEATIPLDQLYLIQAYHHLLVETLETLATVIRSHCVRRQIRETIMAVAVAEVVRAKTLHQNLQSVCENIIQRKHDEGVNWQENVNLPAYELAPLDSMQFPIEGQYSAFNYQPISDHGLGYGLEASTSQPRPQPGLIDFLGADTAWEATPELAPRFGYSHEHRYPLWDDGSSNELHRPSSEHGGFVGGSSMHPGPSTDNIRGPGDSSQYGHQTTSDSRAADSPPRNVLLHLFGPSLDYP
ncbi:hypothetical protein SeLEV6574_g08281 [Synchytrium endobioticum]|uniref:Uncharacterized protein n=1 Tax=Synchytrium endobioticum TaxID=286115 RepID=A0A507C8X9_9FUNG|nr:hypothetical protein SeLEV6574_g08281 [Synchytrium endobioticum]